METIETTHIPNEEKNKLSPELEQKKQNILEAIELTISAIDDNKEGNEENFKKKLQKALDILNDNEIKN